VIRHRSCFAARALLLFFILRVFANGQAKEGAWSKKKSPWVSWQTHTYKVDEGGGTIGLFMSQKDMQVIDLGVALLSMHAPFEMSSR